MPQTWALSDCELKAVFVLEQPAIKLHQVPHGTISYAGLRLLPSSLKPLCFRHLPIHSQTLCKR